MHESMETMVNALRLFWPLSLSLLLYLSGSISAHCHVYIVYLGRIRSHHPDFLASSYHLHLLANVFNSKEEAKQAMVYSYTNTFSGFAATLNASQASILGDKRGVVSVFESNVLHLHTTRSWDFMGLTLDHSHGLTPLQLAHGDDIIVGMFDSGVWPESASFVEEPNMGPVPKNWKGRCDPGEEFDPKKSCNKKVIGAKYYLKGLERRYGRIKKGEEYRSSRDFLGHGTHTASTAVGSRAKGANVLGFGGGVARGGAPRARLAVYKVCWSRASSGSGVCTEEDILAAFDEALHDGVHLISASFGKATPLRQFFASSSDIGSFHAMQLGVSVVFSAGNDGPQLSTVGNVNPWSICVAASNMDRAFPTKILVDQATTFFVGEGLINNPITGALAKARNYFLGGICNTKNWMNVSLSGMVLVCFWSDGGVTSESAEFAAHEAKAAALVFVEPLSRPHAAVSILPLIRIDTIQGTKLHLLPNCTKLHIRPSETAFGQSPAPMVSDFSSRGPSSISPHFLKPDISAPGVNILAAWPPNIAPSVFPSDERSVSWNFISGTSMSCPHVSGLVALLKSAHPHWSPATIRSALITTAYNTDINGDGIQVEASEKSGDPFDVGAGHMNPLKAFDPGLIYDMDTPDYVQFLCNAGYAEEDIEAMIIPPSTPPCAHKHEPDWNINYPSITMSDLRCTTTIKRTLRNVGQSKTAIYFVTTNQPHGVQVVVWPKILVFSPFKEEATYYVTLKPLKVSRGRYDFGSITWSDGFHKVRSPLVVQLNNNAVIHGNGEALAGSINVDY